MLAASITLSMNNLTEFLLSNRMNSQETTKNWCSADLNDGDIDEMRVNKFCALLKSKFPFRSSVFNEHILNQLGQKVSQLELSEIKIHTAPLKHILLP